MTTITTAIRADAATSDAEGRAQAAEMVTALTIGALAETVTRLNASEDRALRLEVQRDELLAQIERIDDMLPPSLSRTMSLADNVRAAVDEAASRDSLTADLNAAREKLTTAEAFRDSLQAEVDGLRVERDAQQADLVGLHCAAAERDTVRELHKSACAERDALRAEVADFFAAAVAVAQALDDGGSLGPAGGERDPRAWVTFARGLADRVGSRVEQAVGNGDNLEAAHEHLATLRAEVDKLRAAVLSEQQKVRSWQRSAEQSNEQLAVVESEVAELRARPELTVGMYRARIDSLPGRAEQVVALLGAVTLPAQDAAAALWKAIDDQIVVEAEKVRDGSGVDWHSAYSGAIGTRAKAEAIVRAALAKLGAPATTPSKPAEDDSLPWGVARARDVPTEVRERGWQWHPIDSDTAFAPPFATIRACRHCGCLVAGGPTACVRCANDSAPTPSKPADVFAGVSEDDLAAALVHAYGSAHVSHSDRVALRAILDALRVKLVAPVDPEMIAAEITRPVAAVVRVSEWKAVKAAARTALDSRGIPVTPEAGK